MAATAQSATIESGKWKIVWLPKAASTLLTAGVLVDLTAGFVTQAGTTTGQNNQPLVGIHVGSTQAAADATTALVPVAIPDDPFAIARITVDTGTPSSTADLGKPFDISANSNITVSTSTHKVVQLVKYISATQGLFLIGNFKPLIA